MAISIRANKEGYLPEENVRISVILRNVGKAPTTVANANDERGFYTFDVTDSKGKLVKLTAYGGEEAERTSRRADHGTTTFEPAEETIPAELPLSRLHDLTVEDTYTVVAKGQIFILKDGKQISRTVISNELKIKIDNRPKKTDENIATSTATTQPDRQRQWGPEVEGFAVSMCAKKDSYLPEEKVQVQVTVKNVSKVEKWISFEHDERGIYDFEITGPKMKRVKLTAYGERESMRTKMRADVGAGTVQPGWEMTADFPLSRLYDLTVEDTYTVVAKGTFSLLVAGKDKIQIIVSDKLKIEIKDRPVKNDETK